MAEFEKQQPSKMDPFASYKVKTETSRADCFAQPEYEVWRRYKDFEWLREQLSLACPTHIIPVREGRGKDVAVLLYVFSRVISFQKGLSCRSWFWCNTPV